MLPASVPTLVCTVPQDTRRSFDTLAAVVRDILLEGPMTLAQPMPPAKVLAQVELEPVDGLSPDWEDATSCGEPAELDIEALLRWSRAGLERGPPEGGETQAGPGPAGLNEGEDPPAW